MSRVRRSNLSSIATWSQDTDFSPADTVHLCEHGIPNLGSRGCASFIEGAPDMLKNSRLVAFKFQSGLVHYTGAFCGWERLIWSSYSKPACKMECASLTRFTIDP